MPHISRRDRYDALDDEEKRRFRRPAEPRYRRDAEALFSGNIKAPPVADTPPVTGKVKWFNAHSGFGFVALDDGNDAFLPARQLKGEDAPTGATITVRIAASQKGFEVTEVIEIDASTALLPSTGVRRPRVDLGESEWTANGMLLAADWRSTYGFLRMEDGSRVFCAGAVMGKCGLTAEAIAGKKLEVGVARGERGPAAVSIRVL